ncbi:MAG: MFS transporter, partial [Candidatus Pacearchaeota archaeon]|nr:MFS transporter [Candidatus Pacearchaeota archaeon]
MKIFQKGELKTLGPFYLERFLSHLLYFLPAFWMISFNNYITLTQIGIVFAITSLISFCLEIPTGAFADIYGRKASTLVGYFFTAVSVFFLFFFKSFLGIFFFMSTWSIAGTFISGAKESWVIDNIKQKKKAPLIKSFFLKDQFIIGLALLLSGVLGTIVVKHWGIEISWIFAAASFLVTFVILSFIPEIKKTKQNHLTFKGIFQQSKKSIKFSLKHNVLFFIIVATFFIILRESFGGDFNEKIFLKLLGLPIPLFGLFFSAISLMILLSPIISHFILEKFKSEKK